MLGRGGGGEGVRGDEGGREEGRREGKGGRRKVGGGGGGKRKEEEETQGPHTQGNIVAKNCCQQQNRTGSLNVSNSCRQHTTMQHCIIHAARGSCDGVR